MRRSGTGAVAALLVAGLVLAGAGGAGAAKGRGGIPDLVGTWVGEYSYPGPDGVAYPSRQTLVVETQRGEHLWGYDEFVDKSGQTVRIPVVGTVSDGEIGLAEQSGFFHGRLRGPDRMRLRFFLVGDRPTSFRVDLKRRP